MTDRTKEYKAYIDLASETLDLLYDLKKVGFEFGEINIRDIATNLCHFQARWATPMELPFGMGTDLKKPIDIQRDAEKMKALDCAVDNPNPVGDSIVIRETSTWKQLVQDGILSADQTPTKITFAAWMEDLFEILVAVYSEPSFSDYQEKCRSIASRWYYHASETDFDESDERVDEADTSREKHAVVKAQSIINSILFGETLPEEEEDEEFEEEEEDEEFEEEEEEEEEDYSKYSEEELQQRAQKAASLKQQGNQYFLSSQMQEALEFYTQAIVTCPSYQYSAVVDDCTKAIEIDPAYLKVLQRRAQAYEELEMLEEAQQDYNRILELDPQNYEAKRCSTLLQAVLTDSAGCINSEMIQTALTNMVSKATKRREELEKQRAESMDTSDGGSELIFTESEKQRTIRENILSCVDKMNAYFPHPKHSIYFIRTLEKMQLEPNSAWFPWGNPPIARIEETLSSSTDAKETVEALRKSCAQ